MPLPYTFKCGCLGACYTSSLCDCGHHVLLQEIKACINLDDVESLHSFLCNLNNNSFEKNLLEFRCKCFGGCTAISMCIQVRAFRCLKMLLQWKTISPDYWHSRVLLTPLLISIASTLHPYISLLCMYGADPHPKIESFWGPTVSPMTASLLMHDLQSVQILMRHGAYLPLVNVFFHKYPDVNPAIDDSTCRIDVSIDLNKSTMETYIFENDTRLGLCPQDYLPTGINYECHSEGYCSKKFEILEYLCNSGCRVVAPYLPASIDNVYLGNLLHVFHSCRDPMTLKASAKHAIIRTASHGRYMAVVASMELPLSLKRYLRSGRHICAYMCTNINELSCVWLFVKGNIRLSYTYLH